MLSEPSSSIAPLSVGEPEALADVRACLVKLNDPLAMLEGIFAFAPLGLQVYRADGHSLLVNRAFCRIFGGPPPPEYNVLKDEIAERTGVLSRIHRAFAGETVHVPAMWYDPRELTQIQVKRGRKVAIEATFFPLFGRDGRVEHVGIVYKDVTVEMLAVQATARANERMRLLAQAGETLSSSIEYETTLHNVAGLAMPSLADFCFFDVLEGDADVRRIPRARDAAKQAILEKMSWALGSRQGVTAPALVSGVAGFHPRIDEAWMWAMAENAEHFELMRRLGFCSMLVVPLLFRERRLGALTLCFAESGRQHTEEDLRLSEDLARLAATSVENARLYRASLEATQRAEEASRTKDEFLSIVSHELRTPLNAVLGWASMLAGRPVEPEVLAKGLASIERNARAQVRIIGDILDVSRIVAGKLRIAPHPVDVEEVVRSAVDAVRSAAEAKTIDLAVAISGSGLVILGDPERLQQIVWNLLTNAIKFTPSGGRVEVRAEAREGEVELAVKDSGIGISPEVLPRVFERFWQADSSSTRSYGGLGLGLAIVKHLVELHGGTVRAESAGVGQGATFSIRLPNKPAVCASDAGEEPRSARKDRDREPVPDELRGLRFLIVDDEPDAREMLVTALSSYGAEVIAVGSAAEARGVLRAFRPDVLVSDIGMPVEDGYELVRKVRSMPSPSRGVFAIALTAYARQEDAEKAILAGFQVHLPKPVEPSALLAVVSHLRRSPFERWPGG